MKLDSKETDALRLDDLAQEHGLTFNSTGMIYRFEDFIACGLDQALGYAEGYDRAMAARTTKESQPTDSAITMGRKRFGMPGRYAVTVECANDLTDDERIMMDAWFETKVDLLQKHERGYTDAQAALWESEALGIAPPPWAVEANDRASAPSTVEFVTGGDVILPAIDAGFLSRFPATCVLGSEKSGDYERHIYFDNGQQVGCWSVYRGQFIGEGEILSDEDAAAVREAWLRRKQTASA